MDFYMKKVNHYRKKQTTIKTTTDKKHVKTTQMYKKILFICALLSICFVAELMQGCQLRAVLPFLSASQLYP